MCILPADVTKVICLFYDKLLTYIQTEQYGVKCDDTALNTIKTILDHYRFECFSNDYIRTLVIDEGSSLDYCTERDSFEPTIEA